MVKDNLQFQCGSCKKTLLTLQGLKRHMMITHSNTRNYQCDECGKVFKHQSNLLTHKKTHTGIKVNCLTCGKYFTTRGNLKKHLKIHVNDDNELEKLWNDNYVTDISIKFGRKKKLIQNDNTKIEIDDESDNVGNSNSTINAFDDSTIVVEPEEFHRKCARNNKNFRLCSLVKDKMNSIKNPGNDYDEGEEDKDYNDEEYQISSDLCVYKCPGCKLMTTKCELIQHMKDNHNELLENNVCILCMVKVNDLKKHKKIHEHAMHNAFLNMSMWAMGRDILHAEPVSEDVYEDDDRLLNHFLTNYQKSLNRISNPGIPAGNVSHSSE